MKTENNQQISRKVEQNSRTVDTSKINSWNNRRRFRTLL